MVQKRENWARGGRTDVWVPEEDPQVAVLRIARDLSEWSKKYLGSKSPPTMTYEYVLDSFQIAYKLGQDEDVREGRNEELPPEVHQAIRMIWLCCNGAEPVAAWMWIEMEPHIEKCGEGGKWVAEYIMPISFDQERDEFAFGLESTWTAMEEEGKNLWILRWALTEVLPGHKNSKIYVMDRNLEVWVENMKAA